MEKPTRKQSALLLSLSFFALYLTVFIANATNVPHYMEKHIENAKEWMAKKKETK